MPLNVKPLVYFAAAFERRSVAEAAAALGAAPSTVSRTVCALERDLATPLFLRRPAGLTATVEGERLAQSAAVILDWLYRLRFARECEPLGVPKPLPRAEPPSRDVCLALLAAPISLRVFADVSAVVEQGSVSAAARRLHLAQPTLGRRIAALERWLGAPLFERGHDGARPSELARRLHEASQEVQALAARTARRGADAFAHKAHDVRLGSVMPAGADSSLAILLAHLLKTSRRREWRRSVALTTATAAELMEQALDGELDAAIVDVADIPGGFRRLEIARRPLHLIASSDVCGAEDDTFDLLARAPIGLPSRGTGLRVAAEAILAGRGLDASRGLECGSIPVLMRLVIEGVCCAVLPRSALPAQETRVRSFALPGPGLLTSLIWTPAKDASPRVAFLKRLVLSEPFV